MIDDIVTRLYDLCLCCCCGCGQSCSDCEVADEIERLRTQVQQWKATATLFYLRHDNRRNCSLITSCKECDAYEALIQKEQQ